MQPSIQTLIDKLHLKPHPEGGYYRETYRSKGIIEANELVAEYGGVRNFSTCIYFLLTSDTFSAFHRILQEEIWHFYLGAPILLHQITPEGKYSTVEIGNDLEAGQVPQLVVPGGIWFGAHVKDENAYSLIGCTVSPGFDFNDFELAERNTLLKTFPQHKEIILRLTR